MRFEHIQIKNFRNILSAQFICNPSVNIFFGENAQGKTNLLEAIHLIAKGKSFRTSDMLVLKNHNTEDNFFVVNGSIERGGLQHQVLFSSEGKKKSIKVNDKALSVAKLSNAFSTVLFSPESLSVIKSGDKERRDLIDEIITSAFVDKSVHVEDYKRLLKQRNKYLKDMLKKETAWSHEESLYFETLTSQFLKSGAKLAYLRVQTLERLLPELNRSMQYIFAQNDVDISVDYVASGEKLTEETEEQIYNAMYKRWQELETAEKQTGFSLVGPHKHDICVLLNKKDTRYYSSQGQQRLVILAFKMAQIELHYCVHGHYPALLLDDVLSELDEQKKMRLIEYLDKIDAQIFITTAERLLQERLGRSGGITTFEIRDGEFWVQPPEGDTRREDAVL